MKIADTDFSDVIERAARTRCAEVDADQEERALIYEECRRWLTGYGSIVENWIPYAHNVRGMVYWRMLAHLCGNPDYAPADNNKVLMWVIAAGLWDEEPRHMRSGPRAPLVTSEDARAEHEWNIANGIWDGYTYIEPYNERIGMYA